MTLLLPEPQSPYMVNETAEGVFDTSNAVTYRDGERIKTKPTWFGRAVGTSSKLLIV